MLLVYVPDIIAINFQCGHQQIVIIDNTVCAATMLVMSWGTPSIYA